MPIEIIYISSEATKDLRQLVLRKGKPRHTCDWEGDKLKSTKHIGAFINSKCVGILSLFENKSNAIREQNQYQLRGLAVHPDHQGKGIGRKLIAFSEYELNQSGIEILWCNARVSASEFYKKLNFEIISDQFHIPNVGSHYVMSKKLA